MLFVLLPGHADGAPCCSSCRAPLDMAQAGSWRYVDRAQLQLFADETCAQSGYVGRIQRAVLAQSADEETLLVCRRCHLLTDRFLRLRAKYGSAGHGARHPVWEVIVYMSNAGVCRHATDRRGRLERKSMLGIAHNLARHTVFPVGHPLFPNGNKQNNELVVQGPETLQCVVSWIQEGVVRLDSMETFKEGCVAAWFETNGYCHWGGSREIMHQIRWLLRRRKEAKA